MTDSARVEEIRRLKENRPQPTDRCTSLAQQRDDLLDAYDALAEKVERLAAANRRLGEGRLERSTRIESLESASADLLVERERLKARLAELEGEA